MQRRCLDCPTLIATGSRCADCQRAHRGARHPRCAIGGCTTPHEDVASTDALVYTMQSVTPERRAVLLCAPHREQARAGGRAKV